MNTKLYPLMVLHLIISAVRSASAETNVLSGLIWMMTKEVTAARHICSSSTEFHGFSKPNLQHRMALQVIGSATRSASAEKNVLLGLLGMMTKEVAAAQHTYSNSTEHRGFNKQSLQHWMAMQVIILANRSALAEKDVLSGLIGMMTKESTAARYTYSNSTEHRGFSKPRLRHQMVLHLIVSGFRSA
jgi:hypothetical protein